MKKTGIENQRDIEEVARKPSKRNKYMIYYNKIKFASLINLKKGISKQWNGI
jgi:hypothetical protein